MDIVTYVLSKAYADKQSTDINATIKEKIAEVQTELDALKTAMASGMLYKGSVDVIADLPASGNKIGDVYTVKENQSEYVWTGEEWFEIGEDLTEEFAAKQDKLTAGTNITIADDATISSKEEIVVAASESEFPATGEVGTIYVSQEDLQMYIWDESLQSYSAARVELTNINSSADYVIDGGTAALI